MAEQRGSILTGGSVASPPRTAPNRAALDADRAASEAVLTKTIARLQTQLTLEENARRAAEDRATAAETRAATAEQAAQANSEEADESTTGREAMRASRDEAVAAMHDESGRRATAEAMLDAERRTREAADRRCNELMARLMTIEAGAEPLPQVPMVPVGYRLTVMARDGNDAIRNVEILPITEKS